MKIYLGLVLLFFCSCTNTPNKEKSQQSQAKIKKEVQIDSSEVFILDDGVYTFMDELFEELSGGSDSNIVIQTVIIPEIDETGYLFQEKSGDILFIPWGEGTTHFYATKEDSIFIRQQLKSRKNKLWIAENFQGITYDSTMLSKYESKNGFEWDQFRNDGYGCFMSYGLPVFNSDSTRCIIQINGSCHGTLGSGHSIFLEKKNDKWKIVGRKKNWMS